MSKVAPSLLNTSRVARDENKMLTLRLKHSHILTFVVSFNCTYTKKNLSVTDPVSRILDVLLRDTTPYVFQQTLYDESKRTPNSGHRRRLSQCTRGFSMFQVYIDHFEIVHEEKGLKKNTNGTLFNNISIFY